MEDIVSQIEGKIRELQAANALLTETCASLQQTNEALLQTVEIKEKENKKIQEQNTALKAGASISEGENKREVKLKINELVRDIDRCINLIISQE